MNQVTLALPFAFPPPELAPDLLRALAAPSLAQLITRNASSAEKPFESDLRVLPHEQWLAETLGLDGGATGPAFAAAAMRGLGLAPQEGHWFIVHPVHIQVARNHLLLADPRRLELDDAEARALFDAAKPYFDELGLTLLYGDAHTWFMRADAWQGLDAASPDAAIGQNLSDWTVQGDGALACRKLQNEVQMLWHSHPVNEQRHARGQAPVNSFWPWAGAASGRAPAVCTIGTDSVPAWLDALATQRNAGATLLEQDAGALAVCGALAGPALAGDWSAWLGEMQRIEQQWCAPLLAALKAGRIGQLRLMLSRRDAHLDIVTSPMAQRKFWQRPSLKRLAP